MLIHFQQIQIFICMSYYSLIQTEKVQVVEILTFENQGDTYHKLSMPWLLMAWGPGDAMGQDISCHGIDLICLELCGPYTICVNTIALFINDY